jgi:hypothetical protein
MRESVCVGAWIPLATKAARRASHWSLRPLGGGRLAAAGDLGSERHGDLDAPPGAQSALRTRKSAEPRPGGLRTGAGGGAAPVACGGPDH